MQTKQFGTDTFICPRKTNIFENQKTKDCIVQFNRKGDNTQRKQRLRLNLEEEEIMEIDADFHFYV